MPLRVEASQLSIAWLLLLCPAYCEHQSDHGQTLRCHGYGKPTSKKLAIDCTRSVTTGALPFCATVRRQAQGVARPAVWTSRRGTAWSSFELDGPIRKQGAAKAFPGFVPGLGDQVQVRPRR